MTPQVHPAGGGPAGIPWWVDLQHFVNLVFMIFIIRSGFQILADHPPPYTLRHPRTVQRVGYALVGPVQRLFQHVDATPGQYREADISPYFWHNGAFPTTDEYRRLFDENFASWRLKIGGLVDNPVELSLDQLRSLPHHEQITQHFCIQGWSGVAKWGGVGMSSILELVRPKPEARWVVFYSLGDGPDGGLYYDAHPIEQMGYHLTMLAYDMNGQPLTYGHGAPPAVAQ